jgi:hypothetical protein
MAVYFTLALLFIIISFNFCKSHIQVIFKKSKEGPGIVAHACNPSYSRGRGGRITVWDWPRRSMRPYLKMNENKNRWGHGPIGRVFA